MEKSRWVILLVAIFVALGGAAYLYSERSGTSFANFEGQLELPRPITVEHALRKDMHTFSGTVQVPPCGTLEAAPELRGNNPVRLTLALKIEKPDSACLSVSPSNQEFSLAVSVGDTELLLDNVTTNNIVTQFSIAEAQ